MIAQILNAEIVERLKGRTIEKVIVRNHGTEITIILDSDSRDGIDSLTIRLDVTADGRYPKAKTSLLANGREIGSIDET